MPNNLNAQKFTLRLNLLNPEHVKIVAILRNLNKKIFKSQNQFIVEALQFYIEYYGTDALKEKKEADEKAAGYITRDELEIIEERVSEDARREAREEASREVMTLMGRMFAGMQGNNIFSQPNTDVISSAEEKDGALEDDVVAEIAMKWMNGGS